MGPIVKKRCMRLSKRCTDIFMFVLLIISQLSIPSIHAQESDSALATACGNQPPPCPDSGSSVNAGGSIHLFRGTFSSEYEVYTLQSFTLPSLPSQLSLSYQNRYNISHSFAYGWNSLLDSRIYDYPVNPILRPVVTYAVVVGPDGKNWTYYTDGAGGYIHPEGYFAELTRNPDGTYDWKRTDGTTWHYDSAGYLQTIKDRNNNTITLHYSTIDVTQPEVIRNYFDNFENNPHLNWTSSSALSGADPKGCHYGDSKYSDVDVNIISEPTEVISGSYSVKASLLPTAGPGRYNDILVSSFNMFKPLTTYRVSFKYKCITPIGNGYIRAGFWNLNDMYNYGRMDEKIELRPTAGEQGLASITYTTKDIQHYGFMIQLFRIGTPNEGTIIFDDIQIQELSSNQPTTKQAVTRITDAQGREAIITYGFNGLVSSVVDPANRTTQFFYSLNNDLIKIIAPESKITEYTYDDTHNLTQIKDPGGNIETIEYFRGSDTVIKVTSTDGGVHQFERDFGATLLDMKTAYVDPQSNRSEATFAVYGDLTYAEVVKKEVLPDGSQKDRQWSLDRRITQDSFTDGTTGQTTTAYNDYDNLGRTIRNQDEAGNETFYTYHPDFTEKIASVQDSTGTTTFEYDTKANVIETTDQLNQTTEYTYDEKGQTSSITQAGQTTTLAYDTNGNLSSVTNALGSTTTFTYDTAGNLLSTTTDGKTITSIYDEQNNLISITDSSGNTTTFSYDAKGNRISSTDSNGYITKYEYDTQNKLVKVIDPAEKITQYAYDVNGNRTSWTNANSNTTLFVYDNLNRLTKMIDPLGNFTTYTYDGRGNLKAKTDAKGNTINYVYDSLNRLIERTYPDAYKDTFTYDPGNRVLSKLSPRVNVQNRYDPLGRLLSRTVNGKTITYEYDNRGNRIKMIDPTGGITTYGNYNALNQLTSITNPDGLTTTYEYDAQGRKTKVRYANATRTEYTYDNNDRVQSLTTFNLTNQIISSYTYAYDKVGNILTMQEANGDTHTYKYDMLYRLTSYEKKDKKKKPLYKSKYKYDAVGNRIELKTNMFGHPEDTEDQLEHPIIKRYTYDKANQLLEIATAKGKGRSNTPWYVKYEYDANGSLVSKTTDSERTSYEYDYENMLKKVTFPDGTTNEFYNCTCGTKRPVKIDSRGYTSFFYEEHSGIEHILLEYDQSDNVRAEYTLGPGIDEIISKTTSEGTIYYHYNSLGSVAMLTDETGKLIGKYEYEPFGQILSQPEEDDETDNRFTFTGREYDKDSGLYFYRARYYDASVGRFMTRDPQLKTISTSPPDCATCGDAHISGCGTSSGLNIFNPSNFHPYVYVRNNPVNLVDPTGLGEICLLCCYARKWSCDSWANAQCDIEKIAAAQRLCELARIECEKHCKTHWWCSEVDFPHD